MKSISILISILTVLVFMTSCLIGGSVNENAGGTGGGGATAGGETVVGPSVVSVTAPAAGHHTSASSTSLDFTLQFSDVVTVSGTPRLAVTIGSIVRYADYVSGSGTLDLLFRYTIIAIRDLDLDGISLASAIDLNGGGIVDGDSVAAQLTFDSPDLSDVTVSYNGLDLWLDVNDSPTVMDAESDSPGEGSFDNVIETWADKSGNSNDAVQMTPGNRPSYVRNVINLSLPIARFNGTSEYLTTTYDASLDTTIFTVFAHDHTGTSFPAGAVWQTQADVATSGFFPMWSNGSQFLAIGGGWINKTSTFNRNEFYYTTVIYNNTASTTELYSNGVLNDSGGAPQTASSNFQVGKRMTHYFRGDIAEILVFNSVLDSTQRAEVEAYLALKWRF